MARNQRTNHRTSHGLETNMGHNTTPSPSPDFMDAAVCFSLPGTTSPSHRPPDHLALECDDPPSSGERERPLWPLPWTTQHLAVTMISIWGEEATPLLSRTGLQPSDESGLTPWNIAPVVLMIIPIFNILLLCLYFCFSQCAWFKASQKTRM